MVNKLLRRLLGGDKEAPAAAAEVAARETYKGCELEAVPVQDAGRWRVAGAVVKTIDGVEKRHEFVRADTFPERDDAVTVSLTKARLLVDQLGDKLFE